MPKESLSVYNKDPSFLLVRTNDHRARNRDLLIRICHNFLIGNDWIREINNPQSVHAVNSFWNQASFLDRMRPSRIIT
jgi:hypothetical protein